MRTIDADKLYPDCMTKNGRLAISQSQIANAPTVTPDMAQVLAYESGKSSERPKGEWKAFDLNYGRSFYYCTVCKETESVPTCLNKPRFKYCPNCGAQMGVDDNDN